MVPKIKRVVEGVVLGEGPHWDTTTQTLYFVDVYGKFIVRYTPATNKFARASVAPKMPSFIIPVQGRKDHFVVSLNNELGLLKWDGKSSECLILEKVCILGESKACTTRINDAKCDSLGRLWAGTIGEFSGALADMKAVGALYSIISNKQIKEHVDNVNCSNGMAFNEKLGKMYYIDSVKEEIDQYDFDLNTGSITNRTVLFSLKNHNIPGVPDGMTIDTDGNLRVAIFLGSRVIKIDGKKPETLLQTINMPTKQVTSLTFGGKKLDELYVTTGRLEIGGEKLLPPVNGATYKITGTDSKGFAGVNFIL